MIGEQWLRERLEEAAGGLDQYLWERSPRPKVKPAELQSGDRFVLDDDYTELTVAAIAPIIGGTRILIEPNHMGITAIEYTPGAMVEKVEW